MSDSGCDSANQIVWARNINTFSLFASGSCPDNYSYTSVQSGDWTDNNTWGVPASCGYPEANDTATITNTTTVTINSSTNAEAYEITINSGGTLNISAGGNLSFSGDGFYWGNYGTLNCNGNSTNGVIINTTDAGTPNYWWIGLTSSSTLHADYTIFDYPESWAVSGKVELDHFEDSHERQGRFYTYEMSANSYIKNSELTALYLHSQANASISGTIDIDNLTLHGPIYPVYNIYNLTLKNINFSAAGYDTLFGVSNATIKVINITSAYLLIFANNAPGEYAEYKFDNATATGYTIFYEWGSSAQAGLSHIYFNNSNFEPDYWTFAPNWGICQAEEGSFGVSLNHNDIPNNYLGWFNNTNASAIDNDYIFGSTDNINIIYGNLVIDENSSLHNLNVSGMFPDLGNSSIDIANNSALTMYGNLTIGNGSTFEITNGSAINITGAGMNYTTFSVSNASNISLNNWDSIPSGLRQVTGRAVNLTNTFASAYTDLNISHACTNKRIWRYNESSTFWEAIDDSSCDAANQVVWAKDITQFSMYSPAECPSKYQSVQSGDWIDNNTWGTPSSDCYPQAGETATINDGHTVEINSSTNAQVFKIWILQGGNLNVSAGANITFDDNGGTDYPGFNTYYYGMTYGNLNVNGNSTNHIHITIANTSSPYTWLYGYFGANANSIIRLHYVDTDHHYNSRPMHWDFDHVVFNNTCCDAFLPWGFATGNNSITNTYFDGRINLYSYPNATLSASDIFDNITVMADMVLYGYYSPVTNLTFTNMFINSGLTAVYPVDNITMINYTSPTYIGWFCPTELGNYSHYYFDNASAVYEYPIVFCWSPIDGGVRMYFNNSDFIFNEPYSQFAMTTNLGTNGSFAISTNHNNTIGDWRGMFLYANSSDIEEKYMFGSSDNININEGTLNIDENADVKNISLDTGHLWNNATLNIDNGASLTSTGNLTISENATFEITNGTATNITLNGTKSTLNAENIQLFNVQSYPADESGLHNISKYVNVSNTSASASLDLNISYSAADLNGKNESELKIYSWNGSDWIAESDTGVDTTNKVVWAKNITSFSIKAVMGNAKPDAPILQSPGNESIVIDLTPTLNWSIPADADGDTLHFEVQLANDSAFAEIVESANSSDDTTGFDPAPPVAEGAGTETYTIQNKLEFRQFWWRVRAFDGAEYSDWGGPFTFNTTTSVVCSLSQSEIDFGSFSPGVNVNATLNFAGPDDGTLYNVTTTSNVNVNITNKGTNLTSGADYIPVSNVGWQSNATNATGSNMIYSSHVDLTEDYDYANMVASNVSENSAIWLRYWLSTVSDQTPGVYAGNYTLKCEQA